MKSLKSLLTTIDDERRLIEGSHVYGEGATFESWTLQRRFIADAIHRPGTLLDIGCANGLLLRCLQEWSKYQIVPYGIDADKELLAMCTRLFSESPHHFAHLSISDLGRLPEAGLPASYDFVYWNVWDDFDFSETWQEEVVESVFRMVAASGRLILGFYDKETAAINSKHAWLRENFAPPSGRKSNWPRGEVIAWWDKG
jgi:SAM-dependent methyltransferase